MLLFAEDNYFIPDLIYIRRENESIILEKHVKGPPDLVVEVVSLDKKKDYVEKKLIYELFGVREYWIVDNDAKEVVVHSLLGGSYSVTNIYRKDMILRSKLGEFSSLEIPLNRIFV